MGLDIRIILPLLAICTFAAPAFAQDSGKPLSELIEAALKGELSYENKLTKEGVEIGFSKSGQAGSSFVRKVKLNTAVATYRAIEADLGLAPKEYRSGKYTVSAIWGEVQANGKVLFDITNDYVQYMRDTDEFSHWVVDWGTGHNVLSLVGRILSWRSITSGFGERAAHPWASQQFAAFDLEKMAPANILDIVDEASLVAALKADAFVQQEVRKAYDASGLAQLAAANTLRDIDKLMSSIRQCEWSWSESGVNSQFAIYDYDVAKNLMAVRIGLGYGCEAARGNLTQLGLWVKPSFMFEYEAKKLVQNNEAVLMKNTESK